MIYTCAVCDRALVTHKDEALPDGTFPPVVSWSAKLEDNYCCADCVEDHMGHGKFEQCRGSRGELGRALLLFALTLEDGADEYMHQEGWGYCGQFGRFLLLEDEQGFVSVEEYKDATAAMHRFDELHDAGMGYQEDDAVLAEDGRVYFGGKELRVWAPRHTDEITERRKLAAIRLEMFKQGFYPNVWRETHYGVELVRDLGF